MRYIHQSGRKDLTAKIIERELDIPQSSVRKTIMEDFPECFRRHSLQKGYVLTGTFPGDEEFDLEPKPIQRTTTTTSQVEVIIPEGAKPPKQTKPAQRKKWKRKFYEQGQSTGKYTYGSQNTSNTMSQHSSIPWNETEDEAHKQRVWTLLNYHKSMVIKIESLMAKDPKARFDELVDSTPENNNER